MYEYHTVEAWIIEPCAMSLDFPLSVRSRNFCFFSASEGGKGLCLYYAFCPVPKKEILDFIAYGSIIRVFTVLEYSCHMFRAILCSSPQ